MTAAVDRQVSQAIQFARDSASDIARVAELMTVATNALLEKLICRVLSGGELEDVKAAVVCGDLHQVFHLIRPQAARMRADDIRDVYWDWVDAYSFYFDSLGTGWPYMTPDTRTRYLTFAEESALIVCSN